MKRMMVILLGMALAGGAWAQGEGSRVQFNFENADIRLVTQIVGKLTGKTFVVPEGVEGKVTILAQGTVGAEEVYPLYLQALEAAGYGVEEQGGVLRVSGLPGGKSGAVGGGARTEVIRLEHASALEVKKALEGVARGGKEGALEVYAPGNDLIVTATAGEMERLKGLISALDSGEGGGSVEMVRLQNAAAEDVAEQLRATFGAADSAAAKAGRHLAQVTGGAGSLPAEFSVVAIPQANSVMLIGAPVQIAEMKRILEKMDVENAEGFGRLNAIFLNYLDAEEASKSLNALLGKGAENEPERRGIAIEPSVANNALLVDATGKDFEHVKRLVAKLDRAPQQVLVEVLIAEMDLEKGLDVGVEWFGIEQPEGKGTGGFGRVRHGESDSMTGLLSGTFPAGLSAGIISGTWKGPDGATYNQLPVYLRAVAGDTDLKILSNIPLWAQNNLEASVSVGENIPILKSSVEGSGGDRDYIQNIERRDVGITLTLTPHVNPENEIQLDLNPCIETVVAGSGENYTPTISKREVKTTVTVPDRRTIVISGLIREDASRIESKVPLLGDLPLLGWLFRSTSETRKRTNLLIFVTPRIVTDPAQAERERERLERAGSLGGAVEEIQEPNGAAEASAATERERKAKGGAGKAKGEKAKRGGKGGASAGGGE